MDKSNDGDWHERKQMEGAETNFLLFVLTHAGGRVLTGQVPPAMMRSKDNASGMPKIEDEPCESMDDSPSDLGFSSPMKEPRAESTWAGRR